VEIDSSDARREKDSANQPEATKKAKPWIWIIVIVLVALGCCVAVMGGGLIYLSNQDLDWRDVLSGGLEEPPAVPEVSINTPVSEAAEQPALQSETAELQNDLPAEPILAVTTSGIWMVDAQTKAAVQISHEALDVSWDLKDGMSPDKKFFAFTTGFSGASANPMLVVLDIENQTSILELELSGPIIRPGAEGEHGDPAFEAYGAMQYTDNLAWSPDATRLAFVAARDGDSADVYLFNRSDGSVTRLTDEAGHAAALHWSPDGQFLQYLSIDTLAPAQALPCRAVGL
jgi:flagellar basal body-associated protein FliL